MYVQKNGDMYRFFERYKVAGKVKTVSVTLDRDTPQTRKKAAEMLRAKMPRVGDDMTFSDLRRLYIEDQKVSFKMSTWKRNEGTLRRVGKKIDDVRLSDLTTGLLRQTLLSMTKDHTSLNEYRARLRAVIRWAYQNDYIESSDCIDKMKRWDAPSAREKAKEKFMEREELKKVIDAAGDYTGAVIEFLALTGLRIGEAIALNREDVTDNEIRVTKNYDYNHGIMTTTKTEDSNRVITVQPELLATIRKIRKISAQHLLVNDSSCPAFIVSPYGGRLSYDNFARTLRELTAKHVGRPLSPHALRHTHTSLLAEEGVPLETISRRLGHADSKVTKMIYTHVTSRVKEKDRKAIRSVAIF